MDPPLTGNFSTTAPLRDSVMFVISASQFMSRPESAASAELDVVNSGSAGSWRMQKMAGEKQFSLMRWGKWDRQAGEGGIISGVARHSDFSRSLFP